MSVSLDTSARNSSSNSGTYSFNYTCSGAERFIRVTIVRSMASAGVNYNGVALTLIRRLSFSALVAVVLEMWGLVNPASGLNAVQIVGSGGAPDTHEVLVDSWNGVHQSSPLGAYVDDFHDAQDSNVTACTTNCTSVDMVVDSYLTYARTMSADAGQTELQNTGNTGGVCSTTGYEVGAASVLTRWFCNSNQLRGQISVPLLSAIPLAQPMKRRAGGMGL